MGEFLKKHLDDIMVYGFGILMVIAGILLACIIVS